MQYDHADLVRDFAQRTQQNLVYLRSAHASGAEVYEVTQLINSMLGLLIFPQQQYVNRIPRTPLGLLEHQGWPIPELVEGRHPKDLRELVRLLRNAVAHCNLSFRSNESMEISGLQAWNINKSGRTTWRGDISIEALETLTDRLLQLLVAEGAA